MKALLLVVTLFISCMGTVSAISMQDLQQPNHYELLPGFGASGKGDGTYIDPASVKGTSTSKGIQQIAVTQFILMPAGDTIVEQHVLYTFDKKLSFTQLMHDKEANKMASYKDLWGLKQNTPGITTTITDYALYHIDGTRYDSESESYRRNMAYVPVDFGYEGYLWANQLYKRVYGVEYDETVLK